MNPIHITDCIQIDSKEIGWVFTRSSGPGGQNVNKVSTAVQLRFSIYGSPSLPGPVKERLVRIAGRRVTGDGTLILESKRRRTQELNRKDALARFADLIRKAAQEPKIRRKTSLPVRSRQRRLENKRRRSTIKQGRQTPAIDE